MQPERLDDILHKKDTFRHAWALLKYKRKGISIRRKQIVELSKRKRIRKRSKKNYKEKASS